MKWNIPYSFIPGSRHSSDGTECQDYALAHLSDAFACVTMTDGAGSVKNACEGARLVAETARNFLIKREAILFEMDESELREELITEIRIKLYELACKMSCEFESFASTFLFFASDGRRFITGNLGDGLVGVIKERNQAEILLAPENGRYLNESFFMTDDDCMYHLRLIHGFFNPSDIYFLMTDGSCDCLYDRQAKTFAEALGIFADWTRRYDHRLVTAAIYKSMFRLFTQRTMDDCAIALIRGVE